METNYKITIPTPCHEDWSQMTTTATGRFCGSCTKNVVDFTAMMPVEIQQYFTANKGQNICGRFKSEQLETLIIQVPSSVLYSQVSFYKAFLLALFIAMGSTLFGCKNENGSVQKIDKVEVVDSLKVNPKPVLLGDTIALPPKPQINKVVKGKIKHNTKEPEVGEIMGAIPLPPEEIILGKPAIEEVPKSEK